MSMMEGYPAIAQIMSNHDELAIFRRFKELNMLNLLYSQAEIIHLEAELKSLREVDKSHPERDFHHRDWWSLAYSQEDGNKEQWQKVLEIRKKLEAYNSRLAQQVFLSRLEAPNPYDLAFLRDWFERPNMGNFPLRGPDQEAWNKESETDLLAIRRRSHEDPFSSWFIDTVIPKFHRVFGSRIKKPIPEAPLSEIAHYPEKALLTAVNILGTLIASLLPISSIIILYFITNTVVQLGVAVAFTATFSICLILLTQAKRIEIFAATSAFAAVQVVFVAGNVVVLG
ncbi:hypothetical protein F5882DRAFT_395221 [Hyaloscypha sp. PMI_1271]|nr:hypothetical protein F5882DRAFT_395221 [Hyaloscypha sp. PMI_1271]